MLCYTIGAVMSKLISAIKDNCTMLKVILILYDGDLEEEKNSRYARKWQDYPEN